MPNDLDNPTGATWFDPADPRRRNAYGGALQRIVPAIVSTYYPGRVRFTGLHDQDAIDRVDIGGISSLIGPGVVKFGLAMDAGLAAMLARGFLAEEVRDQVLIRSGILEIVNQAACLLLYDLGLTVTGVCPPELLPSSAALHAQVSRDPVLLARFDTGHGQLDAFICA